MAIILARATSSGFLISGLTFNRTPILETMWSLLGLGSLTWYVCILSIPLFMWLARNHPLDRNRWRSSLALHSIVTLALVCLTSLLHYWFFLPGPMVRGIDLKFFLTIRLMTESLPFWAMIALTHAFEFYRRYRVQEVEAARLQTQLAEARLESLTAQLRPHFLFNTLQGISTLMRRDVEAADAMLSGLSDLLRQSLLRGDKQEVPLGEELAVLEHYIKICCERFKDRLVFEASVSSEARNCVVPFFILQPLVENAFEHGIVSRAGAGRIEIRGEREGDFLQLTVTDDGPGLDRERREFPSEGIGLSNTRQRLKQLYGDRHTLSLESREGGGLKVKLAIPYKAAPQITI